MVGERPENEEFGRLFDWAEAVTQLPYDSCDIDVVIKSLDQDRERQDRIRQAGIVQALQRFDWAHRWEAVLNTVGLAPMQRLIERKERLTWLAEAIAGNRDSVHGNRVTTPG